MSCNIQPRQCILGMFKVWSGGHEVSIIELMGSREKRGDVLISLTV